MVGNKASAFSWRGPASGDKEWGTSDMNLSGNSAGEVWIQVHDQLCRNIGKPRTNVEELVGYISALSG